MLTAGILALLAWLVWRLRKELDRAVTTRREARLEAARAQAARAQRRKEAARE